MPSLLIADRSATIWLPEQASTHAQVHDGLFYFIYWLSVFFFVVLMSAMTYFAIKYRRRSKDQRTSPNQGNLKLEIVWSAIPAVLLVVIFYWGFRGYMDYLIPPANSLEVRVVGYKWFWEFRYPNGQTSTNELVVPVDTPVRLVMSSEATSPTDPAVIHSFFVPAFRVKRDVLPYRYTVMWFEATEVGEYDIFCAEYCGTGHSKMIGTVRVVPQDEYERELAPDPFDPDVESIAEYGERTYREAGCNACHSVDGSRVVGPTFQGLYGTDRQFADGSSRSADENYIRQSIMEPGSQIVSGYANQMPTYAGRLNDEQVDGLIAYIESLQ